MEDLLELVLSVIDDLTGNQVDYAIGRLADKLTCNIKNKRAKQIVYVLVWALVIILVCAIVLAIAFLIEAWKLGKI